MKQRVQEMEQELEMLTKMQQQVDNQITSASDRLDDNSMWISLNIILSIICSHNEYNF